MTAWGYRSWVPVGVVLATGAFIAVFAYVIRRDRDEEVTR